MEIIRSPSPRAAKRRRRRSAAGWLRCCLEELLDELQVLSIMLLHDGQEALDGDLTHRLQNAPAVKLLRSQSQDDAYVAHPLGGKVLKGAGHRLRVVAALLSEPSPIDIGQKRLLFV